MLTSTDHPPRQIILDTDPGGDDIFALLWLQSLMCQGHADLIAVTTTVGNVGGDRTFASASQVLRLGNLPHIEVGRGVAPPDHEIADAAHIHGTDGMGNLSTTLAPPTHDYSTARGSDDIIIDHLQTHPGQITLIAIGPLTNLAAAETKVPGILKQAKEIVIMGGAFHCRGNVTSHAEFNIHFNPTAAAIVFNSGADIVVLPMDVSTQLVFTAEMAQMAVRSDPTSPLATFLTQLCAFMTNTSLGYRETDGVRGFLVHDAATVAYLFYPETLMLRRAWVQVETQGTWTQGQTLIDRRHRPTLATNAWVALQVEAIALFTSFVEDLNTLNQHLSRI
ncbi:MAG: nucleoside hydrolase [Leptolyngbyaceae bacterium]|nr:nucleoside hydrolase [Leptolyngbyaceae bacterium]